MAPVAGRKWAMGEMFAHQEKSNVAQPVGYNSTAGREQDEGQSTQQQKTQTEKEEAARFQFHAWEFAKGSFKSMGMMAFMMWMSGNGIQIFSIMITATGVFQPIKAIASSGAAFKRFEHPGVDVLMPRLLFCLINLGGLLFASYKLNNMGLLPTSSSDWIAGLAAPKTLEFSVGGDPAF
mmetsp:Transcript_15862/g.49847  ORF Transcript_15862/g.49847 Transcript_15862/m.49847 type:complete len:179 (-) Transcript_15862:14-550(-)